MFPLTGNGELDKDLAEEHQREILEDVQAERIAEGDKEALDSRNYQPLTDSPDDLLPPRESNPHIKGSDETIIND